MVSIIEKLTILEKQAADKGFIWPDVGMILDQIESECQEIREAIHQKEGQARIQEEIGDLLHAVFSLCVFMKFDGQETLTQATNKFEKRLSTLFKIADEQGYTDLKSESIETLISLWKLAKEHDSTL